MWKSLISVGDVTTLIFGSDKGNLFPTSVDRHDFIHVDAVVRNGVSALFRNIVLIEKVLTALDGREFNIGVARYLSLGIVLQNISVPIRILDADDLQKNQAQHANGIGKKLLVAIKESLRRRASRKISRQFDDVWYVTKNDEILVGKKSAWLPNSIMIPREIWSTDDRSQDVLLTVGDFTYGPNIQGLIWFIEKVWPPLKESRLPGSIALNVVGKMPVHLRTSLERHGGVKIKGYIQNLSDEILSSSLFVSGVHSGGGSQIKIIEAMSYGCPVVCHEYARGGFDDVSVEGIDGSFANQPSEWVQKISLILDDSSFAKALGGASRRLIAERFSAASFQKKVQDRLSLLRAFVNPLR